MRKWQSAKCFKSKLDASHKNHDRTRTTPKNPALTEIFDGLYAYNLHDMFEP